MTYFQPDPGRNFSEWFLEFSDFFLCYSVRRELRKRRQEEEPNLVLDELFERVEGASTSDFARRGGRVVKHADSQNSVISSIPPWVTFRKRYW